MKRRGLLLILSVIVAAVGTGLIALYVKGADDRAASDQRIVNVLVANQTIKAGTSAEAMAKGLLDLAKLPANTVPASAITGPNALAEFSATFKGRTNITILPRLQPIVPESFTVAGKAATGGVPADKMGIALALGNPERAITLITPGGEVTVFVTVDGKSKILITKALVLAVDSDKATSAGAGSGLVPDQRAASTVTLAVSVEEAQKLILAKKLKDDAIYLGVPGSDLTAANGLSTGAKPVPVTVLQ